MKTTFLYLLIYHNLFLFLLSFLSIIIVYEFIYSFISFNKTLLL